MSPTELSPGHSDCLADQRKEAPEQNRQERPPAELTERACPGDGLGLEETEPWPDVVDGATLLNELRDTILRYVVLPPMAAETLALWTMHTYAFEMREVSAYIGLGSPEKRCGKTTLLGVLSELVNRPVVASNISPPALFRAIEEMKPTLLIDEADTFLQANEELRGILNSGYTRKTAYVVRVTGEKPGAASSAGLQSGTRSEEAGPPEGGTTRNRNGSRLVRFSCWCPKVIAAIGKLPDTLADRCITITMQRKTPAAKCERLRTLNGRALRQKCLRFVTDHADAIKATQVDVPHQLNDRAGDIWEPLLALAHVAGGEWPNLARETAIKISTGLPESTAIGSLLLDIFAGFIELNVKRMFSRTMVAWLNGMPQRPWMEGRKGKEIDDMWLAHQLRPYGARPKTVWIEGKAAKGYDKTDFDEIWPRYISRGDIDMMVADRGMADEDGAPTAEKEKANNGGHGADVKSVNEANGNGGSATNAEANANQRMEGEKHE